MLGVRVMIISDNHATPIQKNHLVDLFKQSNSPWGMLTSVDLYECDPTLITSKEKISEFTIALCELIEVNRFGDPIIVHFGKDERVKGYSLVQLIETSLVSGHFADNDNAAFIDIFSCKYYDPNAAYDYCFDFFKAKKGSLKTILRGEQ